MRAIEFPQQTTIVAKNQPPYLPLPALVDERHTISCWQFTWKERLRVLLFGQMWLVQLNFGDPLQPIAPCVDPPFVPIVPASEIGDW